MLRCVFDQYACDHLKVLAINKVILCSKNCVLVHVAKTWMRFAHAHLLEKLNTGHFKVLVAVVVCFAQEASLCRTRLRRISNLTTPVKLISKEHSWQKAVSYISGAYNLQTTGDSSLRRWHPIVRQWMISIRLYDGKQGRFSDKEPLSVLYIDKERIIWWNTVFFIKLTLRKLDNHTNKKVQNPTLFQCLPLILLLTFV